jgi:hypothetical protein
VSSLAGVMCMTFPMFPAIILVSCSSARPNMTWLQPLLPTRNSTL